MEGGNGAVQQAVACVRLGRYLQSAVLSRQHHDGAWRREEDDGGDRQVVVTGTRASPPQYNPRIAQLRLHSTPTALPRATLGRRQIPPRKAVEAPRFVNLS